MLRMLESKQSKNNICTKRKALGKVFLNDRDRESFKKTLQQVKKGFHWLCHSYVLMENHYHLLIETVEANLSRGMRQLNGVFTQELNRRYSRVGH
jgi:REP element-mobilizing transposase RayT